MGYSPIIGDRGVYVIIVSFIWNKTNILDSRDPPSRGTIESYVGRISRKLYLIHCPSRSIRVMTLALVGPCLGVFPFVPTFHFSIFLVCVCVYIYTHIYTYTYTHLLLFWCLLFHLISPLLFSCSRYPVWDTHLMHEITVPCSPFTKWSLVFLWRIILKCWKRCYRSTDWVDHIILLLLLSNPFYSI